MNWLAPRFDNTPVSALRPRFGYAPAGLPVPPAVSVITPYFDTGAIFHETARSLLGQSLQAWEWLIVNDGSVEPEALRVLDAYRGLDPRIRIVDLEANRGLPAARNAGLRLAHAEFVFFLDADDLIEPTALEKTAWCLATHPELSFCKGRTVHFGAQEYVTDGGFEAGRAFLKRNPVTIRCLVRRDAALAVGGFDESLITGLEDWDFWLRCASHGYWGRSIPEYLDWYRRRHSHSDRWTAWTPSGERGMRREFRRRYPALYRGAFPSPTEPPPAPFEAVADGAPFANPLAKERARVLFLVPWMAVGGSDRFNLDAIAQLQRRGYEVSVATTLPGNYPWYGEFAALTPDLFILPNFLRPADWPRFLVYLIQSRQIDVVLVSNSEMAYRYLPFLRTRCPEAAFVDFCHMEEEDWDNGGHPRQSVAYQEMLDLNLVSSRHLKEWMTGRGADPAQIEVCTTNVDTKRLRPDPALRQRVRDELAVPPGVPVLLYAARLCPQKQPLLFAEVMHRLAARGVPAVAWVAGDGEDMRRLRAALRRMHLGSRVRLLGAVTSGRLRELMAASDILFLPSRWEGISLTIYEAMAMQVVPVSADVGGQSELVTPECGVLIRPGRGAEQVTAYADALERLLRSPELRSQMGSAARTRVVDQFGLDGMGDRLDQMLREAQRRRRTLPKLEVSPRLAAEHAVQANEHQRVLRASGPLWKYGPLEAARRRAFAAAEPWVHLANLALGKLRPLARLARRVKDTAWRLGHRAKLRLCRQRS